MTSRHVEMYLSKEASQICREVGKHVSYEHNIRNSYEFLVKNEQNSVKVDLVCTHNYTKRVGIYTQVGKTIKTTPVVYIMSKKYDENQHVNSLKLLEKRMLIDH